MTEFRELADLFERLSATVGSGQPIEAALATVTASAVQAIDGAAAAAITRGLAGQFETVAPTSDLANRVDRIQYELMSGPCVDAALERTVFHANDLRTDHRWPEFGRRAADETGVLSMLSYRLYFEDDELQAALNVYATKVDAFDDVAEMTGLALATHAALGLTNAARLGRIEGLERALETNRDIGVAMGILMNRHLATKKQAFDLLRVASQRTHRKLGDIALDVIETGALSYPGARSDPAALDGAGLDGAGSGLAKLSD
jgi:hypothetical protein